VGSLELDPCLALLGCRRAADDHSELWRVDLFIFLQFQHLHLHLREVYLTPGDLLAMHMKEQDEGTLTGKQY